MWEPSRDYAWVREFSQRPRSAILMLTSITWSPVPTRRDWFWKHKILLFHLLCIYVSVKSKVQHAPPPPPGIPRAFDTFDVPSRGGGLGIWLSESSKGWGIWSPCFRGGEFELHPRFHVKSLAWRAIMGGAVLDCAFVASWLRGKGLNKLCAVFEVFKF